MVMTQLILTCKLNVGTGYQRERLIEPSSSWFLPKGAKAKDVVGAGYRGERQGERLIEPSSSWFLLKEAKAKDVVGAGYRGERRGERLIELGSKAKD